MLLPADKEGREPERFAFATLETCFDDDKEVTVKQR